jgi:hypothetical protein
MATAAEIMRRERLQLAVYARFTRNPDARVAAVVQDNAWLLASHAVDAVPEAEGALPVAAAPAAGSGSKTSR